MTARSTRNKIRWQGQSAIINLMKAQKHLAQLAALADDQSGYIDQYLPVIMVSLSAVISSLEDFYEGL